MRLYSRLYWVTRVPDKGVSVSLSEKVAYWKVKVGLVIVRGSLKVFVWDGLFIIIVIHISDLNYFSYYFKLYKRFYF